MDTEITEIMSPALKTYTDQARFRIMPGSVAIAREKAYVLVATEPGDDVSRVVAVLIGKDGIDIAKEEAYWNSAWGTFRRTVGSFTDYLVRKHNMRVIDFGATALLMGENGTITCAILG